MSRASRPLILIVSVIVGLVLLTGCVAPSAPPPAATQPPAPAATEPPAPPPDPMADLIKAAKAEGELTTIALPHDWCNYGEVDRQLQGEVRPEGQRAEPRRRLGRRDRGHQGQQGQQGPAGARRDRRRLRFGPQLKTEGLVQPYKVATWDTIPDDVKDADGYWYGDYYGVLAFEVNKDVVKNVPQDWADLLKPEYKGQVALAGDPRASEPGDP